MKPRDVSLPMVLLSILILGVAFGTQWINWLSSTPLSAWLIDLALLSGLVIVMGIGANGYWFGLLVDGRNKISLSRFQIALWTVLFVATFLVLYIWNVEHAPIDPGTNAKDVAKALSMSVPNTVWLLMGMSGFSAAATPAILSAKPVPDPAGPLPTSPQDATKFLDGIVVKRKEGARPQWSDIVLGDEAGNGDAIDVSKVQQILLSVVAIAAYGYAIAETMLAAGGSIVKELPAMDNGFLALIGASHATYLVYKGVSHSD